MANKTTNLNYGPLDIPSSVTPGNVAVALLTSDGQVQSTQHVPYGTPSVVTPVPSGTGWKIQVRSLDNLGADLPGASPIVSDPFDVTETQTVQVVTSISVS